VFAADCPFARDPTPKIKALPDFQRKRFRKTYATILAAAGNDIVVVSRLLRHSASGKNMAIRH
jgi:hypothetical protein